LNQKARIISDGFSPVPGATMAKNFTYWLNFRIAEDVEHKPGHKQRYEALVEVVEEYALTWWRQSQSLFVIETNVALENLMPVIKKAIAPDHDFVLLVEIGKPSGRICGLFHDKDILTIMPFLEQV
jgi:hypothetical protein